MSSTNNAASDSTLEQKVADLAAQVAAIPTIYATKADVQRLEREILEIKLLLQQILAVMTRDRLPQNGLGLNVPAHETPEPNTQVPAVAVNAIPAASAPQTQAGSLRDGKEANSATASSMPEVVMPTVSTDVPSK